MLILGNVNSSVLFKEKKIIIRPQIQIKINKVDYFVDEKEVRLHEEARGLSTWLELAHTNDYALQANLISRALDTLVQ